MAIVYFHNHDSDLDKWFIVRMPGQNLCEGALTARDTKHITIRSVWIVPGTVDPNE